MYPLHHAVMREVIDEDERQEIIGELITAGADVNVKTADVRLLVLLFCIIRGSLFFPYIRSRFCFIVSAVSERSGQPAYQRSLIRAFFICMKFLLPPILYRAYLDGAHHVVETHRMIFIRWLENSEEKFSRDAAHIEQYIAKSHISLSIQTV